MSVEPAVGVGVSPVGPGVAFVPAPPSQKWALARPSRSRDISTSSAGGDGQQRVIVAGIAVVAFPSLASP